MVSESFKKTLKKGVEKVSESAVDYLRNKAENAGDRIEKRIVEIEKNLLKKLTGSVFIILGVVFLGLALFHLLRDIAGLNDTLSYLTLGVIVLFLGILFNNLKGGR